MDTTAEEIAAVFARIQDGCARRDAAAVAALYAEDCVVETPIVGRQVGRSAVEHAYRFMFSAFPDLSLHTEEFLVFGKRAVWTVIATGSDLGGFMGLGPTGKSVSTQVMSLFTFGNDGEIVHERQMFDSGRGLLYLADKGLTPTDSRRLETGGMVVGLFEHTNFDEQTLQLETGDLLVAYSDGVTEARNFEGHEFGEERLLACVRANSDLGPADLLDGIFDAVDQFSAGTAQFDDLTLLALRLVGGR